MIKSFRKPTPNSLISVIQSQVAYSTTKKDKRERLLRIRSEQKQLYGSVIRDNPDKNIETIESTAPPPPPPSQFDGTNSSNDVKAVTRESANEYHWLVELQSSSKHVKIFKSGTLEEVRPNNNKPSPVKSSNSISYEAAPKQTSDEVPANSYTSQSSMLNPKSAIISAKNLLQQMMQSKRSNAPNKKPQQIPFDEDGLKSIVNYSLVCEKKSQSQVDELIANRSLRLPSISKVLQGTMPESARIALRKWKLGKIEELGFDGFKQYEQNTLNRGKEFHLAIEEFLNRGQIPERDSTIIQLWDSIDSSLNALKPKSVLSEQPILHADLKYRGIIDNVSIVNDELSAFEWKTSEKSKPRLTSTYDAPVQLCAYLGALNADPRYDLTVKHGYVIVAYTNGTAANVFKLSEADLRKYWLIWLQRLQEYWIRVRDGTLPDPI